MEMEFAKPAASQECKEGGKKKKINNSKIAKLHMVPVNFEELQGMGGTLLRCKDDFFF